MLITTVLLYYVVNFLFVGYSICFNLFFQTMHIESFYLFYFSRKQKILSRYGSDIALR